MPKLPKGLSHTEIQQYLKDLVANRSFSEKVSDFIFECITPLLILMSIVSIGLVFYGLWEHSLK